MATAAAAEATGLSWKVFALPNGCTSKHAASMLSTATKPFPVKLDLQQQVLDCRAGEVAAALQKLLDKGDVMLCNGHLHMDIGQSFNVVGATWLTDLQITVQSLAHRGSFVVGPAQHQQAARLHVSHCSVTSVLSPDGSSFAMADGPSACITMDSCQFVGVQYAVHARGGAVAKLSACCALVHLNNNTEVGVDLVQVR